jgi:hypothetical protein
MYVILPSEGSVACVGEAEWFGAPIPPLDGEGGERSEQGGAAAAR